MRIRHVVRGRCNPENANGVVTHVYHLAHAQLRLGHDVEVYGVASRAESPEVIDRDGLVVRAYPTTSVPIAVHPSLAAHVRRADARDDTVFVLHSSYELPVYGLGRALHRLSIPYLFASHGSWMPEALARSALKKRVFKLFFDRPLLQDAAGVLATAAGELPAISTYAPRTRAFAVRNSMDFGAIDSVTVDDSFWQRRFGIDRSHRIFVYLGRLDPYQKGLDLLLEAWQDAVGRSGQEVSLALVGPSWKEGTQQLTELRRRLGLEGSVCFTGPLHGEEKFQALLGADVYVQTSRFETSPYSIQEAMACSLPVIVTPGTNFARMVDRYDAGFAPDMSTEAIASALVAAMQLPEEDLAAMGKSGRRLVEERHSLDRAARRAVEAYRAAVSGEPFDNDD